MKKFAKTMFLTCALLHLTLVTMSASYVRIADWFLGKNFIEWYQKASGADSSYGFFAPAPGLKTRGVFDIVKTSGEKIEDIHFIPTTEREAQIRMGGIFEEFTSEEFEFPEFRKPLASGLAAVIFSRYNDASEAKLRIQGYQSVSMEEYRQGLRSQWADYYTAQFSRSTR
ncbi:MAG: hypothetical protein KC505_03335 [Myxococcales bacterium]|nr:hypothetical protein [Myxococcales bacterium]USN49786.1 MAG: hypothetical protein H6731_05755 [Myxococcales bacterium]